jgi:hypothetical protein
VFLAFVSLLPFPSDLIGFDDRSPSAVIAFCAVGGAATPCEFALWRHLHRNRDLLLLPYVPEGLVVELRNWRFWSLGLFVVSLLVFLPLYEFAHHRRRARHGRTLYLVRDL